VRGQSKRDPENTLERKNVPWCGISSPKGKCKKGKCTKWQCAVRRLGSKPAAEGHQKPQTSLAKGQSLLRAVITVEDKSRRLWELLPTRKAELEAGAKLTQTSVAGYFQMDVRRTVLQSNANAKKARQAKQGSPGSRAVQVERRQKKRAKKWRCRSIKPTREGDKKIHGA